MPRTTLAEMLGIAEDEARTDRPLPEAQIATLQEHYHRMRHDADPDAAPRLREGAIVTAVPGGGASSSIQGQPMIVVELLPVGDRLACSDAAHRHRENVRVAFLDNDGDVVLGWLESWRLEPYRKGAKS